MSVCFLKLITVATDSSIRQKLSFLFITGYQVGSAKCILIYNAHANLENYIYNSTITKGRFQEVGVPLGCASSTSYASFVLSKVNSRVHP